MFSVNFIGASGVCPEKSTYIYVTTRWLNEVLFDLKSVDNLFFLCTHSRYADTAFCLWIMRVWCMGPYDRCAV